jgi:hypothetical protein
MIQTSVLAVFEVRGVPVHWPYIRNAAINSHASESVLVNVQEFQQS